MRVRTAAGLHQANLDRVANVRDVKDAHAAESIRANVSLNAFKSAIEPCAAVLNTHNQNVADDRNVALSAGANDRTDQFRNAIFAQFIGVKAVIVPGNHHIAREGNIGVRE